MRVSAVEVTSVVISCLASGIEVSFLSGHLADEGVGKESFRITNVCRA